MCILCDRTELDEEEAEGEWQAVSGKDGGTSKDQGKSQKPRSEPKHGAAGAGAGVGGACVYTSYTLNIYYMCIVQTYKSK